MWHPFKQANSEGDMLHKKYCQKSKYNAMLCVGMQRSAMQYESTLQCNTMQLNCMQCEPRNYSWNAICYMES